jgi:DNA polymerase-3 subunit beta
VSLEALEDLAETHTDAAEGVVLAFETKKFTLDGLLSKAANVIPSRDLMPMLKNFLVAVDDKFLKVAATDIELSVIAQTGMVKADTLGRAVFPAKKLQDIVREAPDGEIRVEVEVVDEAFTATITAGKATWRLRLLNVDDYPDLPNADEATFQKVSKAKFASALKQVRQAASSDTMRASLMLVDINEGRMRASDGVRFQQVKMPFPMNMQVPINAVDDLVKVLSLSESAEFEVSDTDNHLLFRINDDLFIAQKLTVDFPDVDDVLLKPALTNEDVLHVDRMELIKAIRRVRITADEETSAVVLTLEPERITVSSKEKNGSMSSESLDCTWKGENGRILAFNHGHLLDMLNMASAKSCEFRLGKDLKTRPSALLLVDDEAGMQGVLNQMRISLLD